MRISNRPQGSFAIRSCVNRDASFGINWSSTVEVDLPAPTTTSLDIFDDVDHSFSHPHHHLDTTSIDAATTTASAKKALELDEDSSVLSAISEGQLTSTNSSDDSQHNNSQNAILSNGCDVEVESCGAADCDLGMTTTVSPLPTKSKDAAPPIADDDTLSSHTLSRREFCDSQVAQYRAYLEERRRCQDELEFHRLHYDAMLGDMYQRHNRNPHADGIPSIEFESGEDAPNPIDEQASRNRLNSIRHIISEGARRDMLAIRALREQQVQSNVGDKPSTQESFVRAKYMHRLYWTHVMDDTINLLSSTDHTPLNTPPTYHAYSTVLNRLSQRQMWRGPVSSCYKLVVEKASASSPHKSVSKRRGGYYHGLIKEAESLRDGSIKLQAWRALQESTLRRINPASGSLFVSTSSSK